MSEKCNDFLSAFHAYLSSQILRNLFSHLLYRIHNLPDLLSGNFIDMHATGADGHGTAGTTDFFRQHPAQYLIFMSGAVPHRGSRTPAPVSGQRFPWYGLHYTADMRLFSSGETDLKVLTNLHYRHFHHASCGCCLFRQHPFHLRYSFTSTPNGDSSFAARCVTISSIDSGF